MIPAITMHKKLNLLQVYRGMVTQRGVWSMSQCLYTKNYKNKKP